LNVFRISHRFLRSSTTLAMPRGRKRLSNEEGSGWWQASREWSRASHWWGESLQNQSSNDETMTVDGTAQSAAADHAPWNRKENERDSSVERRCSDAKLRLVQSRNSLVEKQTTALLGVLNNLPYQEQSYDSCLDAFEDMSLQSALLDDIHTVLEIDSWEGSPSGKQWLQDWLQNGQRWAADLEHVPAAKTGQHYCQLCWKSYISHDEFQWHVQQRDHRKRQRVWTWRYGSAEPPSTSRSQQVCSADTPHHSNSVHGEPSVSKHVAEARAKTKHLEDSPAASAKCQLIAYRNSLSQQRRCAVLHSIGLDRANDISNLAALQKHFNDDIAAALALVSDSDWIYKEPTFSWLSGFYWHPESTRLQQQGPQHSPHFCHLCEVDAWSQDDAERHKTTKRHAENAYRWVEVMGTTEHPSKCGRCPQSPGTTYSKDPFDLNHQRPAGASNADVPSESSPPKGFKSIYDGDKGQVLAVPYLAVIAKVHARVHALRIATNSLRVGPTVKLWGKIKRSFVNLTWCITGQCWRSLAIPVEDAHHNQVIYFTVLAQWSSGDSDWDEIGNIDIEVPATGVVAVKHWEHGKRRSGWVDSIPVLQFVGRGQIDAAGGVDALRGQQLTLQFANGDVMISFLLYVPLANERRRLLMFFHGDMTRGLQQCPQPGLPDFASVYGPALLVVDSKKHSHPCRDFVVVTPCCSDRVWWFRHPSVHDGAAYVQSVEDCIHGLIRMLYELELCKRKVCFMGQSMGAYAALEIARAIPDSTAGVVAFAPCFDACRLDHLASRLSNVPLWLLIGRNDAICSFEEVASLALKMRDLNSKCVRLSSVGIRDHSEVGKKLEKWEIYEWLHNPTA